MLATFGCVVYKLINVVVTDNACKYFYQQSLNLLPINIWGFLNR